MTQQYFILAASFCQLISFLFRQTCQMHLFIAEIEILEIFCDDNDDEPVEDFLQGQDDELFLKTGTQKLQK